MNPLDRIKGLRRRNLQALVAQQGGHGAQRRFAERAGIPYKFVNNLLRGEKDISEDTARRVEQALALPLGWMDVDHTVEKPSSAAANDQGELMVVSEEERQIILAFRSMSSGKQIAFKTVVDSLAEQKVGNGALADSG